MSDTELHFASGRYDRVQPLLDGRVTIPGIRLRHEALTPELLFPRALQGGEFDLFELSLSGFFRRIAHGQRDILGLPIFISRAFRHSAIYIRTDRGISEPLSLKGRVVGVPDYAMTGAVWVRGFLQDDYGIRPGDITWRTGGLHEPGQSLLTAATTAGLDIRAIPAHETLSDQLAKGAIDALISSDIPHAFTQQAPHVGRLFTDYRSAEQDYVRRTLLFPIMHLVVVRRAVLDRFADLQKVLLAAFETAKALAFHDLEQLTALHSLLPWGPAELDATRAIMGMDYWPYGLAANRRALDTFVRFSRDQGLLPSNFSFESAFVLA